MIHSMESKETVLFKPQSVGTSATATGTASVLGWDYGEVVIYLDTAAATSTDAVVQLSEGDGTAFATALDLAMATVAPNTSTPEIYKWFLSLKTRKKNLKISYTPSGAARLGMAVLRLSRPEQSPATAAGRGVNGQVIA